jgi:hypothetical protein
MHCRIGASESVLPHPCMTQEAAARRAKYLATAIELRKMALQAQSSELRAGFMRLAVLYEELAEYAARARELQPKDEAK